ncbi:5-bromo-4-chloroindolyl phosphate hydrolysis family protein [Granulicatella elegans]|uniref:5-bromo-4-chloroindolyl phosphate hydrolysis family protein n=1 Tax=Granulicatella elegans TaxID=137732 RepID=UPI000AF07415|nr:5-bromo-4-chloroindolyl phosphate hydrolysis family protein [Granulicatella elegans]UEA30896.1 5-bromo-4-chloroindolyl phosphate hydrolysis family protein [Granulicatella elegans]
MKKHMIQAIKLFFFVAVSVGVYEKMDNTAEMFLFALLCYGIFFYVLFRKEMNPPNWKTYLHKEKELQGPSEKQQEIYEKAGLTESDVSFFREKMNRAKIQIQQIEVYTKQNNKLEAIANRYQIITVLKDYFKEIVQHPERLHAVDKFLNTYLPGLEEMMEKYIEIEQHISKTQETYQMLDQTMDFIGDCCLQIEADYQKFQAQDFSDLNLEREHLQQQSQKEEFEDF